MKYKLVTLVLAVAVIASLVFGGCAKPAPAPAVPLLAPAAPAPAPTPAQPVPDPIGWYKPAPTPPAPGEFRVLDPRGWEPAVEYQGLSPRLDTLVGKKVGLADPAMGEATLKAIGADLEAIVPGCNTEYKRIGHSITGEDADFVKSCDAVILGVNY